MKLYSSLLKGSRDDKNTLRLRTAQLNITSMLMAKLQVKGPIASRWHRCKFAVKWEGLLILWLKFTITSIINSLNARK